MKRTVKIIQLQHCGNWLKLKTRLWDIVWSLQIHVSMKKKLYCNYIPISKAWIFSGFIHNLTILSCGGTFLSMLWGVVCHSAQCPNGVTKVKNRKCHFWPRSILSNLERGVFDKKVISKHFRALNLSSFKPYFDLLSCRMSVFHTKTSKTIQILRPFLTISH